ncbi:MAG: hypothetical protein ACXVD0_10020, partial [Nocardioides sp.]
APTTAVAEPTPAAPASRPLATVLPPEPPDPADERRHPARPVDLVAADVVAQMQQAQTATLRHLEAIEAETTRRCELLVAQAELDAELIRLHARREAHAIITAARLRAGERELGDEGRRLAEAGDALNRVSDATESALEPPRRWRAGS